MKDVKIVLLFSVVCAFALSCTNKTSNMPQGAIPKFGIFSMNLDGSNVALISGGENERNHVHVNPVNGKLVFSEFTKDLNMDGKADESVEM